MPVLHIYVYFLYHFQPYFGLHENKQLTTAVIATRLGYENILTIIPLGP